MFKFIRNFLFTTKSMKESTLDLFCEYEDKRDADEFAQYVENMSKEHCVSCDYILQEFILD